MASKEELKKQEYGQEEIKEILKIQKEIKTKPYITLDDLKERLPYKSFDQSRSPYIRHVHIGQRKLLMSEVEFLTKYGHLASTVLYVGAAPSEHMGFLSDLFPKITFELWDPAKFRIYGLHEENKKRIKIFNDFFTDEVAEKYRQRRKNGEKFIFITDLRLSSEDKKIFEEKVNGDNMAQAKWMKTIKPEVSMFKFRIPYYDIKTKKKYTEKSTYEYLDGTIYLQTFGPPHTSETRLVVLKDAKMKKYPALEYEEKLYYFNNIVREFQKYDTPKELMKKVQGLDHCQDCALEVYIWKKYINYLQKNKKKTSELIDEIATCMNLANKIPNKSLLRGNHGKL
jgi:hypothetical protein